MKTLSYYSEVKHVSKLVRNIGMDDEKGFTLVELIVVIAVLSVLLVVALPNIQGYIENVKEEVCDVNTLHLERMYEIHLVLEGKVHSNIIFTQYKEEYGENICPDGGTIDYVDEEVRCRVHDEGIEEDNSDIDEDEGGVPYL